MGRDSWWLSHLIPIPGRRSLKIRGNHSKQRSDSMVIGWGCHGNSEKLTQPTASGPQLAVLWTAAASHLHLVGGLGATGRRRGGYRSGLSWESSSTCVLKTFSGATAILGFWQIPLLASLNSEPYGERDPGKCHPCFSQ